MAPRLVLASSSPYRRRLLTDAGYRFEVAEPAVDERSLDHLLATRGPEIMAIEIARAKARSIDVDDALVLAADQVGLLDGATEPMTKPGTVERAVDQLTAMSGRTHRLVNGIVLRDTSTRKEWTASDVHVVRMKSFDRADAAAYVERVRPLDSVGAYRLEDDAGLIASIDGSGASGVIGLPLDVVAGLLDDAGYRTEG
jgi:septum formation protein